MDKVHLPQRQEDTSKRLLLTAKSPGSFAIHLIEGWYFETDLKTEVKIIFLWNHLTLMIATTE